MKTNNLNNIKYLREAIEELKYQLNQAIDVNNLCVHDTIQLSQELDKLIVQYYKSV